MEQYMKALRKNLYQTMNKRDWNLTELAVQCGMSYENLHKILCGKRKTVTLDTLENISQGTDIPIDVLIGIQGKNKKDADFIDNLSAIVLSYVQRSSVAV